MEVCFPGVARRSRGDLANPRLLLRVVAEIAKLSGTRGFQNSARTEVRGSLWVTVNRPWSSGTVPRGEEVNGGEEQDAGEVEKEHIPRDSREAQPAPRSPRKSGRGGQAVQAEKHELV